MQLEKKNINIINKNDIITSEKNWMKRNEKTGHKDNNNENIQKTERFQT